MLTFQEEFLTCDSEDAMSKRIKTAKGEPMINREVALKQAGIELYQIPDISTVSIPSDFGVASFSGYGEFTPITVRADTVLTYADMERDQRRD